MKRERIALCLAARDPRTPWYAKVLAAVVLACALSPIDLIPDFIPVLGYLDDVILVPAGIALVLRLVPPEVMANCRERARTRAGRPISRIGAAVIVGIWVALVVGVLLFVRELLAQTFAA